MPKINTGEEVRGKRCDRYVFTCLSICSVCVLAAQAWSDPGSLPVWSLLLHSGGSLVFGLLQLAVNHGLGMSPIAMF